MGDTRHGLGATVGDFDNDGYPDLYVSNLGYNVMYRNNGDGSFAEVSAQTGTAVADEVRVGVGRLLPGHGRRTATWICLSRTT